MLSTFLLNLMFANKSHGAEGWRDSPSASLWVILPCDAQGKKICISSMTNLAVCFHGDGAHIIYFSPHFAPPFLSAHPFLFPLRPSHCIAFDSLSMRYSTVIRDIEPFRGKIHFALDLVFSLSVDAASSERCGRESAEGAVEG